MLTEQATGHFKTISKLHLTTSSNQQAMPVSILDFIILETAHHSSCFCKCKLKFPNLFFNIQGAGWDRLRNRTDQLAKCHRCNCPNCKVANCVALERCHRASLPVHFDFSPCSYYTLQSYFPSPNYKSTLPQEISVPYPGLGHAPKRIRNRTGFCCAAIEFAFRFECNHQRRRHHHPGLLMDADRRKSTRFPLLSPVPIQYKMTQEIPKTTETRNCASLPEMFCILDGHHWFPVSRGRILLHSAVSCIQSTNPLHFIPLTRVVVYRKNAKLFVDKDKAPHGRAECCPAAWRFSNEFLVKFLMEILVKFFMEFLKEFLMEFIIYRPA